MADMMSAAWEASGLMYSGFTPGLVALKRKIRSLAAEISALPSFDPGSRLSAGMVSWLKVCS